MTRFALFTIAMVLMAAPLSAATYKNSTYQAVTRSFAVALQPRDGIGETRQARQVFVTVSRLDRAGLAQSELGQAGGFAQQVGCAGGQVLGSIAAGHSATAAEFELLCVGG